MKKTLVALAALAAFGTASAQVSVYGKVDLGVSSTTTSGDPTSVDKGLEVGSGNYEGSRFGVKASHDLPGGLKALAQYEFKVDAAEYKKAITSDRVATLGLTGGFGTVTMGLQWTPYDSAWGFDQLEYNGFSAASNAWGSGKHVDKGNTGGGNAKKSISYTTPDMSGFNATVLFANAEKTLTESPAPYVGLGVNYAAGPLSVNFGYEQLASTIQNTTAGANDKTTASIIGASYNLGVATVGVGFQQANVDVGTTGWKDAGYTLTVGVPVSASTTVALGYASETTTAALNADGKTTSFGAQAVYNWTKQAAIYAGVVQTKSTPAALLTAAAATETTTTKYAAGLRYNF